MKTQFTTFTAGILTGLCLFLSLSASMKEEDESRLTTHVVANTETDALATNEYIEVPIGEFFNDVARYRKQHAKVIEPRIPRRARNDSTSRMFLYSVSTLESFFADVKALARTAEIPPKQIAIRFYYGVYPLGQRIAGENYSSLHTLFMVPNYWSDEDKRFRDLNLRELAARISKDGYGNYANMKDTLIKEYYLENMYEKDKKNARAFMLDASAIKYTGPLPVKKGGFFPSFFVADPPVTNQGQLCPPNCPKNSLLDYIDSRPLEFPGEW